MNTEKQNQKQQVKHKVAFDQHNLHQKTFQECQLPLKSIQNIGQPKNDKQHVKNNKQTQQTNLQGNQYEKQKAQQNHLTLEQLKQRLAKLTNYIRFLNIGSEQIWQEQKEISINEFANILNQKYGYYLSNWQLSAVLQLSQNKKKLMIKNFAPLEIWKESQDQRHYLKKLSKTASSSKIYKRVPSKEIKRTQSKTIQANSSQLKQRKKTTNESTYTLDCQQAQQYSKSRKEGKINSLKKDIQESILQNKWDFIVMVGEINQWIQTIRKQIQQTPEIINNFPADISNYRYRVVNREHIEIVQQDIYTENCKQIPQVVFLKRYENLKKKMIKADSNKNNLKGTVLMVLEENDKLTKTNLHNRLNQRDQELNYVLLEVMRMKSIFQWQNKLLSDASINS